MSSASLLNVSRLEGPNTRASSVAPSFETWISRMAWRGNMVASAGKGMRVSDSGRGRVSKQRWAWLEAGPYLSHRPAFDPPSPHARRHANLHGDWGTRAETNH